MHYFLGLDLLFFLWSVNPGHCRISTWLQMSPLSELFRKLGVLFFFTERKNTWKSCLYSNLGSKKALSYVFFFYLKQLDCVSHHCMYYKKFLVIFFFFLHILNGSLSEAAKSYICCINSM